LLFLMLRICCRFFSFGLLTVPFLVALPLQIQFWGTQRRKTHSKIVQESQP
jgi:hypothetical protein